MDRQNPYFNQVRLLVNVLPAIAESTCFALKGGTAINLFLRNVPRLSVDIDLVYVLIKERDFSLNEITDELLKIASRIKKIIPNAEIQYSYINKTKFITKLLVRSERSIVKIELSPVLRGTVYEPKTKRISRDAEELFGFAEVPVVSFEDLFAGKIIAALDRQHPRDLFDIKFLLQSEGITHSLKEAFIVYLISHNRRFIEILNPSLLNLSQLYQNEFTGMTNEKISIEELELVRTELIEKVNGLLEDEDKTFLINFKKGNPDWDYFSVPHIRELPAVKWKLNNLQQMDSAERSKMIQNLIDFFS